jgi:hypothetical protein
MFLNLIEMNSLEEIKIMIERNFNVNDKSTWTEEQLTFSMKLGLLLLDTNRVTHAAEIIERKLREANYQARVIK